eukprot:8548516-Alexandrium_andersonii.AAC.1
MLDTCPNKLALTTPSVAYDQEPLQHGERRNRPGGIVLKTPCLSNKNPVSYTHLRAHETSAHL